METQSPLFAFHSFMPGASALDATLERLHNRVVSLVVDTLAFQLIGTPHLYADGADCTPGPKPFTLLVYLVLEARPISRSHIIDLLWNGSDESSARRSLRSTLSALRGSVGADLLETHGDSLRIGSSLRVATDLEELQAHADGIRETAAIRFDGGRPPALLHEPFMSGVRIDGSPEADEWFERMQYRVELLQNTANYRLVRSLLDQGRISDAGTLSDRWFARDPALSDAAVARMLWADADGRRSEIELIYQEHRRALSVLDGEPTEELDVLYREIAGSRSSVGAGPVRDWSAPMKPSSLHLADDRIVGRDEILDVCARTLEMGPLITIWAPGGAGKTRLALELGSRLQERFRHGVWFVALAEIESGELVASSIAAALGLQRESDITLEETVAGFIADRELALILDNCEHVTAAAARIAELVTRTIGDSRVIVTSREPLEIPAERVIQLPPLAVLGEADDMQDIDDLFDSPAIELFVERAVRFQPDFVLDDTTRQPVLTICRRVNGLPLAIEIAAASLRTLSVEEVAESIDGRFARLRNSSAFRARGHDTIHEVIDWSYRLLSAPAAQFLQRLSVFPASFRLESAEAVCSNIRRHDTVSRDTIVSLLDELVRKSLVTVRRADGRSLYSVFELVRVFGAEQLRESGLMDVMRERLLQWVLRVGDETLTKSFGAGVPEPAAAEHERRTRRFRAELPNVRNAIDFCLSTDRVSEGLRILVDFDLYWWSEDLTSELLGYLNRFLPASDASDPLTTVSAYALAAAHTWGMSEENPQPYIDAATRIIRSTTFDASAASAHPTRTKIALLYWIASTSEAAVNWRDLAEQTVQVGRTLNPRHQLQCLVRAASVFGNRGDSERAQSLVAEAEAMGIVDHEFFTLRGVWLANEERWLEAEEVLQDGLRDAAGGNYWFPGALADLVGTCVEVLVQLGRHAARLGFVAWALQNHWKSGARAGYYESGRRMVRAYADCGAYDRAARLRGFCESVRARIPPHIVHLVDQHGVSLGPPEGPDLIAQDIVAEEMETGRLMSVHEAAELGLADARGFASDDGASQTWLDLLDRAVHLQVSRLR